MRKLIEPLDDEEVAEFEAANLVVVIDGKPYNREDLYSCDVCELVTPDPADIDENGLCEHCAEEARKEAKHIEELRADWRASQL